MVRCLRVRKLVLRRFRCNQLEFADAQLVLLRRYRMHQLANVQLLMEAEQLQH